jgi:Phosphotransferase enzyme family
MTSTKDTKQELSRRVERVTRSDFLDARVRPCLGAEAGPNGHWDTRVIQLDGTGAATVEIRYDGRRSVFAKLYPNDSAPLIYDKLRALRAAGFGPGERYQAVEPLGYVPEYALLLTRGAEGPAVSAHIGGDSGALSAGVREAARWLAKLHASPVRIGPPQSLLVSGELLSLARRLAKVMTQRPGHLGLALEMIQTLERLAEDTAEGLLVQGHGQYRPIHVFLGAAVTVIDLDRSRPCDPARDVAEFVHRLRMTTFSHAGSVEPAEVPTREFLEAYASAVPRRAYLANLPFHWARYVFHSLNNKLKGEGRSGPELEATVQFYRSEFEKVIQGRFRT